MLLSSVEYSRKLDTPEEIIERENKDFSMGIKRKNKIKGLGLNYFLIVC